MPETRRRLLAAMAGIAAGTFAGRSTFAGQMTPHPQPMASPNAPSNQNAPAGLDRAGVEAGEQQSKITPLAWSQIKADVDKLFQMTSDFKEHVAQTNLAATLPLPLIKEAHQIEKLAKQIQEHMKG
jgi:hypothetical protein